MQSNDFRGFLRRLGSAALFLMACSLGLGMVADEAAAQGYTQLQVLLPGETAAPGTSGGKLGTPIEQTVGTAFDIVVRATDASWNTVGTINNSILVGASDQGATLPGAFTLVGGESTVSVTLSASGSFNFTADDQTDGTIPTANSAFVTARLLQGFEFSRISQKNQNAGAPMNITVEAIDPTGQRVAGFNGVIALQELTSFGVGRIAPSSIQLSGGSWTGNLTMYRADETSINRGNVNIYAYWPTDPSRNGTSDPFTVHPGNFSKVQLIVPGQSPEPGSVNGSTGSPASHGADEVFAVEVYATDNYWNPVPSGDTVRVTSSDTAASTPVTGAMTNGFRQFTLSLGTVGTQTLTVNDQTNGSIQGMTTDPIPVISGNVNQFVIDPFATPATAGNAVTVTIRAADSAGNTIPAFDGDAILTANTGPGSISPSQISFGSGFWTGEITFRGAGGAVALTCADYASPPHTGTSPSFEVLPGPFVGLQVVVPGETPAGGTIKGVSGLPDDQASGSAFNMQLRAVDAYWNRVSGITDRVVVWSSDAFAAVPDTVNLVNGLLSVPVTLFAAGAQTVSVADVDNGSIASHTSSPIYVVPGSYGRIVLVAPGESLAPGQPEGRAGTATDQSINFSFTVSVYATDNWGNPVTGISDVISISSNDPLAQLPADAAMVDGRADMVVRLATGGFQQITATNVSQPAIGTSTTQVRAISSGLHLEASISPSSVGAGEPFNLTVSVTNDAGAVIQEINSFVSVTVTNASTQNPGRGTLLNTSFQLLQGQRTISETYTFAEDIVLRVTDDAGNQPAVTGVLTVTPGTPASIAFTSNPSWLRGNKTAQLSAQLLDAYGNGVPDAPMNFTRLAGQAELTPIDVTTDGEGIARAELLAPRTPEVATIQAQSGAITQQLDVETALVNPNAAGGYVGNFPNPFHPEENPTTIAYKLDDDAKVRLRIFTLTGGLVLDETVPKGDVGAQQGLNQYLWDGKNGDGEFVASGGYILLIEAEGSGETLHTMRRKIGVVR